MVWFPSIGSGYSADGCMCNDACVSVLCLFLAKYTIKLNDKSGELLQQMNMTETFLSYMLFRNVLRNEKKIEIQQVLHFS